jgi:3-oxoacyl-[acyl-carrier-protein] synthase III
MKVETISQRIPSRKITNEDILDFLAVYTDGSVSKKVLFAYRRLVRGLLIKTGSKVRYIRDKAKGEKASTLVIEAMQEALEKAGMDIKDIDLLIYCGVGKGFLEPANAYFYANALKMSCSCFDVADACMSWTRALEIAYEFFQSGRYRNIMIVNGEFNSDHGLPDNFEVKSLSQLEYTFPTYTIGEAATATIVTASDRQWSFHFRSAPDLCDLCNIPLEGFESYVEPSGRLARNGLNNFVAYGREMFASAEKHLVELMREVIPDFNEPDIYFPHAASSATYLTNARRIGISQEKMYAQVFPRYGNIVSASIPVGMDMAISEGRLQRGHKVVFCPASAGMVYGVVQFVY